MSTSVLNGGEFCLRLDQQLSKVLDHGTSLNGGKRSQVIGPEL